MHIELGIIEPLRISGANLAATALVVSQLPALIKAPTLGVRALAVGAGVAVLMQSWHLAVGPSELHLIGATTAYLLAGLPAAIVGFALALLLQTLVEPQDMYHIGVNCLSLGLPLLAVHYSFGKRLFDTAVGERFTMARVLRLDAVYYAGVASMVAFWLMISGRAMPVADWATWAAAYLPVFAVEAMISFAVVWGLRQWRGGIYTRFTEAGRLTFAKA
jgi:cobalt/nickel transport system permease protein